MTYEELSAKINYADNETGKGNYEIGEQLAKEVIVELDKLNGPHEAESSIGRVRALAHLLLTNVAVYRGANDTALEQAQYAIDLANEFTLDDVLNKVHILLGNCYNNLGYHHKALEYYSKALAGYEELGEESKIAKVTGNIGIVYYSLGSFAKSLEYYSRALVIYEGLGDQAGIAGNITNIGLVYTNLGLYDKSLENYSKAIGIFEDIGDQSKIAVVRGNIANVYFCLGNYEMALEYSWKSLAYNEEHGLKSKSAVVTGNIGNVYLQLGIYDKALEYYNKALAVHDELGEQAKSALVRSHLGRLYKTPEFKGYDALKAEEYLLNAIAIGEAIGEKYNQYNAHRALAELYKTEKRWEECQIHFERFYDIKEEVQSEEAKNQAALIEEQKLVAEREKEIAISNAKHTAIEQLLHNVLPPSIANKMLSGNKIIAEKLSNVSVLFADIVNFTKLSQRITPEELVEGLDRIFSEFDNLAEKYGLEKIKTIGDAYMVVSGAPEPREDHAEVMAKFAVEMLEAIKQFRSISTGEQIQLRIGIHTGEVVAGIIGKKKFAYDMWGDAVNTAARMESHGEVDRIHVSEDFRNSIGSQFTFFERSEVDIKGKGLMKTYFLEKT